MATTSKVKSHRIGMPVLIKGRAIQDVMTSPCKVTITSFPDPASALELGWTPERIMADCRRMPREELTPKLERRLLAAGLTEKQVYELYRHTRALIGAIRKTFWEKSKPEIDTEESDVCASVKLKSLEEAKQYGIKLPDVREENDEMGDPMTFAKGLVIGMPAREALEKCLPARMKEITKELLQACVDGGLTKDEIAQGFGTTLASLNWKASQIKFKFPDGRRRGADKQNDVAAANKAAALTSTQVEALANATSTLNPPPAPAAGQVPPAPPLPPEPKPEPSIWIHHFGIVEKHEGPELLVTKNGKLTIRRVDMDIDLRYDFYFDEDYRHCKVEDNPRGMKLTKTKSESCAFGCSLRQLTKEMVAREMAFPVRYRLDPETMIGERVGEHAAVQA